MKFSEWLTDELEKRGWSRSEAARRGRISPSTFDKVINGHAKPGLKFLNGVAKAFGLPPVEVYRIAGFLPSQPDDDALIEEIRAMVEDMPPEERENIYEYARMRRRIMEEKQQVESKRKPRPA